MGIWCLYNMRPTYELSLFEEVILKILRIVCTLRLNIIGYAVDNLFDTENLVLLFNGNCAQFDTLVKIFRDGQNTFVGYIILGKSNTLSIVNIYAYL